MQDTAARFGSPQFGLYSPPSGLEPVQFKKGDQCQWRILATHGEKIILNITRLDIPASQDCLQDYLEVRDGYWAKSPLLGRLCGSTSPPPLISTGSRMMVTYRTQVDSPDHRGFTAQYEAVCGGDLDMETGQLESPNFPEDYQPNKGRTPENRFTFTLTMRCSIQCAIIRKFIAKSGVLTIIILYLHIDISERGTTGMHLADSSSRGFPSGSQVPIFRN